MTKLFSRKLLSVLLVVLLAVAALSGCSGNQTPAEPSAPAATQNEITDGASVGEGAVSFAFEITDNEGKTIHLTVNTDAETVGQALLDAGLIAGEESEYGLYVKTVNGLTADYDTDHAYWAFYVDGGYANSGVDSTAIEDGKVYAFVFTQE